MAIKLLNTLKEWAEQSTYSTIPFALSRVRAPVDHGEPASGRCRRRCWPDGGRRLLGQSFHCSPSVVQAAGAHALEGGSGEEVRRARGEYWERTLAMVGRVCVCLSVYLSGVTASDCPTTCASLAISERPAVFGCSTVVLPRIHPTQMEYGWSSPLSAFVMLSFTRSLFLSHGKWLPIRRTLPCQVGLHIV